jgi:hypothetical protein
MSLFAQAIANLSSWRDWRFLRVQGECAVCLQFHPRSQLRLLEPVTAELICNDCVNEAADAPDASAGGEHPSHAVAATTDDRK